MRFSIIAATSLFLCHNAMATPVSDEALPMLIDAPLVSESETLDKRLPIEGLDKRLAIEDLVALLGVGNMAAFLALGIANLIAARVKSLSDYNSCGIISGNIDGVNYQYHAATTGKNCDTTAEVKTIRDAIERALNFMVSHNLNHVCINMQHGGTWRGLLQLAGGGREIINNKCDDITYTFTI